MEEESPFAESADYVFTIKDKNVLDDKNDGDTKDILENDKFNSVNDYPDNDNTKNDTEIELNEDGEINSNDNIDKIKEKFSLMKNRTKLNKVFLEPKKKFNKEYFTKEEFKKREKKKKKIQPKTLLLSSEIEEINSTVRGRENLLSFNEKEEEELEEEKLRLENITQKEAIKKSEANPLLKTINKDDDMEEITEGKTQNKEEVISSYSLFLKNLPGYKDIEDKKNKVLSAKNFSLKNLNDGTVSIVNITLPNEKIEYGEKQKEDDTPIPLPNLTQRGPEIDHEKAVLEEPSTRKGVCIALDIFKKRGLLKEEEALGRYKDKAHTTNDYLMNKSNDKRKKEINIEYRDELGRKLKPKEMARYQSHIFHGEGPGIKKTEKQLLREQNKQKLQNSSVFLNSKTMRYMKYEQEKKNKPFAVLEGKNYSAFL